MTGALLRTGNLKAFEPLGALGNPVYLAAPQLRAAIGRRLGADVAGTLAIPRRNQDGDTIDWYAPKPGSVVPWSAATPEERAQANDRLLEIRERIEELRQAMQSEEAGERQTFGHLLEHATSFPGDDHVYLVDGRPVITFWGFRHQNAPVGSNPLLSPDVVAQSAPVENKGRGLSWWWLLPLLLALTLLMFWLLRGCEGPPAPTVDEPQEVPLPPAPTSADEETAPPQEPIGEEISEPEPYADLVQPERVLHRGETRIVDSDGTAIEHSRVVGGAVVEVDRVAGDAVEGAVTSGEVESTDVLAAEAEGPQTEAAGMDTLTESPDEKKMGAGDLGQPAAEPEGSEGAAGNTLPDGPAEQPTGADVPGAQPPPDEALEEPATPEQANEQSLPPAASHSESVPGGTPDSGASDLVQTPEPTASDAAGKQGDSGEEQATGEGPKPEPTAPRQGDDAPPLKLPPGAVGAGSTQFLNGGWRTSTSLQDPRTALPVEMEYRLQNGSGSLRLRRSDGSVCSGQVKAIIEDGKLVVRNVRDIRCPDGTNFGRPRLECIPGKDGRADCSGRYQTGEEFSVDIKKSE